MSNVTIKTKIAFVSLSISLISVLVISILFYSIYSQSIIHSTIDMNMQSTKYLSDYLNTYFKDIELTAVEIYNETEPIKISILDIIKNGYSTDASDYYMEREILNKYFIFIQNQRKSIVKTVVLSEDLEVVDTYNRNNIYSNIDLKPLLQKFVKDNDDDSLFFSYDLPEINEKLLIYKKVVYDLFTHKELATLLFFIDYNQFEWEKYTLHNNEFMILNQYNEFIYHSDPQYLSMKADNNLIQLLNSKESNYFLDNKELINYDHLLNDDLKLINIAPLHELKRNKAMAMYITLAIIMCTIFFNSILSILYAKRITKPIKILCQTMKEVENGNFNIIIPHTKGKDEIAVLNKNFNYMTSKIKEMIQFQYQLEIKNREAQLMVLQSQINPHFLYNTLQTIGGKAVLNNDYEIGTMCKALSDIFRYSIQSSNKEATIEEELFHVSNYLYIQKIRFDDCIDTSIHIEEDLKACLVPRILLQPIIENAIMHGIEKVDMERESISIDIRKNHENILITIEDNGPGIGEKRLRSILKHINREPMEISSGLTLRPSIGLRNVNARIKILYGNPFGIEVKNKNPNGVTVTMVLPYKKEVSYVSSDAC